MTEYELQEEHQINIKQLFEAVTKLRGFVADDNELMKLLEENNARTFPDYETFFYWLHQDSTTEQLIKLMLDKTNYAETSIYAELEDGTIIFVYQ